jgi:hypothetical protein
MQIILLLILAAIPSTLARGWTIPEGQPDGLYGVTTDESGNFIHVPMVLAPHNLTLIDLGNDQPTVSSAKFLKRQIGGITEGCGGYALDPTGTNNAVNHLIAFSVQNSQTVPALFDWYALDGQVVAYWCNFFTGSL